MDSKLSAVLPSKTIALSDKVKPETVGLVIVLFVNVSVVFLPTNWSEAALGNVNVISELGLPGAKVVSKLSLVEPSKIMLPDTRPLKTIVSEALSPRLTVPPLNVDVPVTVKLPAIVVLDHSLSC